MFYCYIHLKLDTDEVFYIGKGKNTKKRSREKCGRSEWWKRIVDKHGLRIEILEYFELEEDAFAMERYLISSYKELGLEIINRTLGGEGASGNIKSLKTKMLHKEIFTNNWKSQEFRSKVHEGKKKYLQSKEGKETLALNMKKRFENPEYKEKIISKLHKANMLRSKDFKCVETGTIFKTQISATNWLKSVGFLKASRLGVRSALVGNYKQAYGYHWEYI